jgi:hypothetical protein
MDVICLKDIKSIIRQDNDVHVSIFMPTHHRGGVDQQDPIRYRNLLRAAEEKLVAKGMRPAEAKSLLKPAEGLATDNLFWRQQSEGLALFLDPSMYLYYRVPITLNEEVGVGERFYVKQLVSLLSDCGWYYVLAVSHHDTRLLQCTAFGSIRINLADVPKNMDEALNFDVPDHRMQYHVPAPNGGSNFGGGTAIQSGESSRPNYVKRNILQYFDLVNNGIMKVLKDERAPLILAAVDDMQPLYRTANSYRNILPEGILGNADGVSDDTLREQAWSIVKFYFEQTKKEAAADYLKIAGTGLTAAGISDVVPAAYHGRIRFLFLAENVQQWGSYNTAADSVTVHSSQKPEDEDLMDLAAYQTLSHAGTIYVMKTGEVPGGGPVAATLRF